MAGGTLFKALHPSTGRHPDALLASAVATAAGARAAGAEVALVGVGAAPLRRASSRLLARRLASLTDVLVLRDVGSADCLRDAGLAPPFRVGSDAAWTILDDPPVSRHREGIVVALSHLAGGQGPAGLDDLTAWVAAALWELTEDHPVALQPWQPGSADDELADRLAAILGDRVEVLAPPPDLPTATSQLAGARAVIALRFHALVAAAAASTPVVALAHEPKLGSLAQRLDQPAVSPSQSPDALVAAVRSAVRRGPADPAAVQRERQRAHETLRLLRVYLDGGTDPHETDLPSLDLECTPWRR